MLSCAFAGICAGCPEIEQTRAHQLRTHHDRFHALWRAAGLPSSSLPEIVLVDLGPGGLRDRVDLTLHREADGTRLGLYDRHTREIIDLTACPQMTPALAAWHQRFRRDHLPRIQLGHLRLRVAPDGTRGIWLDFPNKLIAELLEEGTWLTGLAAVARVELSQRRNSLLTRETHLMLGDPVLYPWFETYGAEGRPIPLYGQIGGFTQPGFLANRALVALVGSIVAANPAERWLELGSGIGNFTLNLAAQDRAVIALESDPRAIAGLIHAAAEQALANRIEIMQANMHHHTEGLRDTIQRVDAILVDPPRSGLGNFSGMLEAVPAHRRPETIIYVSCFAESLLEDLSRLRPLGYTARSITCLDQFPQSRHAEWVVGLRRRS